MHKSVRPRARHLKPTWPHGARTGNNCWGRKVATQLRICVEYPSKLVNTFPFMVFAVINERDDARKFDRLEKRATVLNIVVVNRAIRQIAGFEMH